MNCDTRLTVKRNGLKPVTKHDLLLMLKDISLTLTKYSKEQQRYDNLNFSKVNFKQTVINEKCSLQNLSNREKKTERENVTLTDLNNMITGMKTTLENNLEIQKRYDAIYFKKPNYVFISSYTVETMNLEKSKMNVACKKLKTIKVQRLPSRKRLSRIFNRPGCTKSKGLLAIHIISCGWAQVNDTNATWKFRRKVISLKFVWIYGKILKNGYVGETS